MFFRVHSLFSNLDQSFRVAKLQRFMVFIVSQLRQSVEKSNFSDFEVRVLPTASMVRGLLLTDKPGSCSGSVDENFGSTQQNSL